jgi:SH3/ankyrin repeat-containing protein
LWAFSRIIINNNNSTEASPDAIDINGLTPLFYSILYKAELKVTQFLLHHLNSNKNPSSLSFSDGQIPGDSDNASGNQMEIVDQHGWQAIHYAAKYGLSGHLEKLLYYGCDINAKIRGSGNTSLHVAAINDQLQVIIAKIS